MCLPLFHVHCMIIIAYTNAMLIVTIGKIEKRAVLEEDEIKIRNVINMTLSLDHRYTDGARAVIIYQRFYNYLHDPERMIAEDLASGNERVNI